MGSGNVKVSLSIGDVKKMISYNVSGITVTVAVCTSAGEWVKEECFLQGKKSRGFKNKKLKIKRFQDWIRDQSWILRGD